MRKSDLLIGLLGGSLAVLVTGQACRNANAPVAQYEEAGAAVVSQECQLLTGFTQNQTVITVCAYAEEILYIATFIAGFMRHGQSIDAGTCQPLKGTAVCATAEELGKVLPIIIDRRLEKLTFSKGGVK